MRYVPGGNFLPMPAVELRVSYITVPLESYLRMKKPQAPSSLTIDVNVPSFCKVNGSPSNLSFSPCLVPFIVRPEARMSVAYTTEDMAKISNTIVRVIGIRLYIVFSSPPAFNQQES